MEPTQKLCVLENVHPNHTLTWDWYISIPSTYGILTYIWLMFMVNVGKHTIHGSLWVYLHLPLKKNK